MYFDKSIDIFNLFDFKLPLQKSDLHFLSSQTDKIWS